jgi:hypothetical protein
MITRAMTLRAAFFAVVLPIAALAQCGTFAINFNAYGSGCSSFGSSPPLLTGFYTHGSCQITLTLSGTPEACPGLCLVQKLIAVGTAPTQVPLGLVPCDLLVDPIFFLSLPAGAGDNFVVTLPAISLSGLQVYVHGGNVFLTPSGYVYEVANALHLDYL